MSQSNWFAWACLFASAGLVALATVYIAQALAEPPPTFYDSRYPALAKNQHVMEDFMNVMFYLFGAAVTAGAAYCLATPTSLIRRYGGRNYAMAWLATVIVLAMGAGLAANPPAG